MILETNKEKLKQLAIYFYNITKTLIAIYDTNMNLICSYPNHMCDFCSEIRKSPDLKFKCLNDDNAAFKICKSIRKTYIYNCHMGLIEVATPIIYNNQILGYMLFGQITNQKNKKHINKTITQVAENYNLDKKILLNASEKIRYRNRDYINSISALLEMCANYIWLNSIISVQNEGLAYSLELYIRENLCNDLSTPALCQQFNYGRSKLNEIAHNNFGCSLGNYIQICRLDKAKELLNNTHFSIAEVAEKSGFKDVNYFIRFFKKHTGLTPKKYQLCKQQIQ